MVQVPTSEYSMNHPLVCQECELACTSKNSYSTTALKPFSVIFKEKCCMLHILNCFMYNMYVCCIFLMECPVFGCRSLLQSSWSASETD